MTQNSCLQVQPLQPFSRSDAPLVTLAVAIAVQAQQLELVYTLQGDLEPIAIAPPTVKPQRGDALWETTCFEFFLGHGDSSAYWEFNLSPSGDWNVYHFTDYRQGMQRETQISTLPFVVDHQADQLQLTLSLNLEKLGIMPDAPDNLHLSVTTVIQTRSGVCSYWAIHHPAAVADFHDRRGFTINLSR
ncbi:MAG: DOMON-like domain-containing protein [Synechococcales bacterium]|nr:DOMON-like domain-containing protein [Synechococcales bacterium]